MYNTFTFFHKIIITCSPFSDPVKEVSNVSNGSLTIFEGRQPKESLESFIDRVVNPDSKYTSQTKAAIHTVSELMKSKSVEHKIGTTIKVSK